MQNAVGDSFGTFDRKLSSCRFDHAAIADLSAGLGIETGLVQYQSDGSFGVREWAAGAVL
jgi:hypothetical protein